MKRELIDYGKFKPDMFKRGHFCKYAFYKEECKASDLARFGDFMAFLERQAKDARQKVLFMTHDYGDDKRLLFLIPEVVSYVRALLEKYPYFWYYATPISSEYLLFCLLRMNMIHFTGDPERDSDLFSANVSPGQLTNLLKGMMLSLDGYGKEIKDMQGVVRSFKAWSDYIMRVTSFSPPEDGVIVKL